MEPITSDKAPKAVGPYTQAIKAQNMLFCSGQIGIEPATGLLAEGIELQTKQIFSNIKAVLEEAGTTLSHIIKTTVYLSSMTDYTPMNAIYESELKGHKPARTTIGVASLPKDALIEIEVIALIA